MPELQEQLYCSQQIVIPPKYPFILKKYAKAAIKTQPYDLLRWSYEYFRAVADGRPPPVKTRLEYPAYGTEGGLTRGYLKILANQLAGYEEVPIPKLQEIWEGSCLDVEEFKRILCLGDVFMRSETVSRLKFLAVAAGLLTKSLTHTMILLCETLTKEPEGGSAALPVDVFLEMYKGLASIEASKEVTFYNGWREGLQPIETPPIEEEEEENKSTTSNETPSKKLRQMSTALLGDKVEEGVVAGRQMSFTSGEFIVQQIEKDMMTKIGDIIDILPDPSLRKRKAKPEEVQMIRRILEDFLDENMDVIAPEEEVEEEEKPVPQVVVVPAVAGIGPQVDEDTLSTFVEYALQVSKVQADCFMPRNIRHFMCPPLESYLEVDYDKPDEELPADGTMTV